MALVSPEENKLKYYHLLAVLIISAELFYSSVVFGSLAGVSPGLSGSVDTVRPLMEKPYFVDIGSRNVTAILGQSATLSCRVKHPGERTISWMRKRDLHILTSGIHTYTGDGRFSVMHAEHSDDWDLHIEYVQKHDGGVYECQVNTEPKINMAVLLIVEDAQARIWGSADVYVKRGSTISLTCSVNVQAAPPAAVLWFHGGAAVDFDSARGGISLETERADHGVTSKLLVTRASLADSGNYTCVPSNASPASVQVHVLNGEHPAAMQTSRAPSAVHRSPISMYTILYCLNMISINR